MHETPLIMGILNVTPDSFYDGGKFDVVDTALARVQEMMEEGADIIDIGGESTGPGSGDVNTEEELRRIIPVIEKVRIANYEAQKKNVTSQCAIRDSRFAMSIDTYKTEVALRALDAGATMVNDVTAGRGDPDMFSVIAEAGCAYIMMHSKDATARTTITNVSYDDVIKTIHDFFEKRISAAEKAGIRRENIILDPGLGHFISSDPTYSWYVLEHIEELNDFGCPILVSPSRKSFTAAVPGQPPSERLEGTLKATGVALKHGAAIIRTHDVAETINIVSR